MSGTEEEISTTLSMLQDVAENHGGEITKFFGVLSVNLKFETFNFLDFEISDQVLSEQLMQFAI